MTIQQYSYAVIVILERDREVQVMVKDAAALILDVVKFYEDGMTPEYAAERAKQDMVRQYLEHVVPASGLTH